MGVVLRNLQKVVPLRRARLRRDVTTLMHVLGVQKFDLGVICVDNRRMQQINSTYRRKNMPTDVLSFPFYEVNEELKAATNKKLDRICGACPRDQ